MSPTGRRLVVLRHAQSEAGDGGSDHARALDDRGRRDAARLGARLRELGWVPQVVIASDATRARQTWEQLRQPLGGAPAVTFTRALYLVGIDEIRAALRAQATEVETVMTIGHNPGWEDAVHVLSGVRARLSPCAAVLLRTTAGTWADAADRSGWGFEALLWPDGG